MPDTPPPSLDPAALQARLTGILEAAIDAIVTVDHAGRFLDFNPAAERIFGYPRAAVLGRDMTDLIVPPQHREHHRAGMARLYAGGAPKMLGRRIEIGAIRADGTEFPVELTITRLAGEGPPLFTAHLRDITERKTTEARLLALQTQLEERIAERTADLARTHAALEATATSQRESQTSFERSFHSNPAIMTISRVSDARLIEVNPSFLRLCGLTRDQAIGHTTVSLGLWARPAQRDEFLQRLLASPSVRDFEADFRRADGQTFSLLLNADHLEIGGEACMLTVGIDITERRRRDRVQAATYAISQAALAGGDLPALFAELHRIVGSLIDAKNFYVALLNPDRSLLSFPYFVDETAAPPAPRKPGFGLTEYVINTARPLRSTADELTVILRADDRYRPTGKPSALWLGAPLMIEGRAIGVITVQDYHNPTAYTEADLQLLMFVADQAAVAVHRRQIDTAQREARAYFEKSFHASSALMSIARVADGAILEINPAFLRGSGYTRDEVIGKTTADLRVWHHPAQRDEFIGRIRTAGFIRDFSTEFRSKAGAIRTLLLNADLIELGGATCILTVGIDITERRRRDQVQAATYAISQLVLGDGDLPALFAGVHRIIAGLMPAQNLYVALVSDDGTQHTFPYFVDAIVPPPEPRAPQNGFTEYVLATGRPLLTTAPELAAILSARGPYTPPERPAAQRLGAPLLIGGRAVGVIALQDYDNPAAYGPDELQLLGFVAEQTAATVQRHRAEAARARAEANYRSIFENALEGLYLSSVDGRFLRINPALARMCGYAGPAAMMAATNDIGRQLYAHPRRREEFFQLIKGNDTVTDFESEILRADGSTFWISESVRAVRDAAGHVDHFEGVAIDITQRREAARVLQAAKDAADTASRSKSRFLASVSHELRTPLNGILGYTQILRRDPTLAEKQRDGVRVIHESADHLLALINDILDLSKVEAGRLELHPADFDLPGFAEGAERIFAPRAREKNLLLETALAVDLPRFVRGDEQRLRQVIFNLLGNAVKFTARGGVVFSVQPVAPAAPGAAPVLRFSVSDTGPGIAAEDLGRIFEPFTQVGDSARSATGTGLGLAISRSLVEHLGGHLQVESRVGWGSRFWFDLALPIARGDTLPHSAHAARRVLGYEGPRLRLLVVDDNATNRSVLVNLLTPLGFEVTAAESGEAAVAQASASTPALILMDLRLPGGIDGLEATRRIRATPAGRHVPIIAVSASAYDLDRSECFAAGCVAFLAKPFREEELWNLLERTLGLTWLCAESEETRSPFPHVVHAPPPAEAAAFYELAAKGDVFGIRTRAQALLAADPQLAPFAQVILDLAARFKMKTIRQFVARYLPPSA